MSSENPFSPPAAPLAPVDPKLTSSRNPYFIKPIAAATTWVVALLVLNLLTTVSVGALDVAGHLMIDNYAAGEFEPEGVGLIIVLGMVLMALLLIPIGIGCVIAFCIWMYRSNNNAHAFGVSGMDTTPGWSVGFWFIPIANLFKPYQAVCEIYRASEAMDRKKPTQDTSTLRWKSVQVPAFFGAWWFFWIVGNIISRIEMRMELLGDGLGDAALPVSVASTVMTAIAAVLAIMVVRRISSIQQRCIERMESSDPFDAA